MAGPPTGSPGTGSGAGLVSFGAGTSEESIAGGGNTRWAQLDVFGGATVTVGGG